MGISQIKEISKNLKKIKFHLKKMFLSLKMHHLVTQKIYKTNVKNCALFIKKNNISSPAIIIIR